MAGTLERMLRSGIVAIVRSDSAEGMFETAQALVKGGIEAFEITLTTPGALDAISKLAARNDGSFVVGAGSVLDGESARAAILAGAEFVVMPITNVEAIRVAKRYGKVVCPGALTPTEAVQAWEAGADLVKVFPAATFGPGYIKAMKAPLPQIKFMPTGGITLDNVGDFIKQGASAVGVGGKLVSKELIGGKKWSEISDIARQYVSAIAQAREKQ